MALGQVGRFKGAYTEVRQGDLLITITGANVTKAALVRGDIVRGYVSQHVALCRFKELLIPEYVYWYVVSETAGRAQLTDMAYGAGKPGLNLTNIREVTISVPNKQIQEETVQVIDDRIEKIDRLNAVIEQNMRKIETLRQSILKCAFEGKLVPQDPNDEPASTLLERIRQEQGDQPERRRGNHTAGATA